MNHDQFTYWLQGFVEMNNGHYPSPEQWQMIKDHLKLCFNKMTPPLQPYARGVGTGGVGDGVLKSGTTSFTTDGKTIFHGFGGGGRPNDIVFSLNGFTTPDGTFHQYPKGTGGGVGSGTFSASGGSIDGSGAGWPMDKYGNRLTNAQIQAQKSKGGGGGC